MASRESQGFLFTIIILTILLFVTGGLAVWMFMRTNELSDNLANEKTNVTKANKDRNTWYELVKICKIQIGTPDANYGELASLRNSVNGSSDQEAKKALQQIDAAFTTIVGQKIELENTSSVNPTYQSVVQSLSTVLSKKHNELAVSENQKNSAEQTHKIEIGKVNRKLTDVQTKLSNAETKLRDATTRFTKTEEDYKRAADEMRSTIAESGNKQNRLIADHNKIQQQMTTEIQKFKSENKELQDQLKKLTATNNTIPDGRIISVDKQGDYVQINLGKLDQLKIKQNFLVFDRDETNFETAIPKAKIEVTRVARDGDHLADAKIHEQTLGNPILRGDHILSPTWDPGYRVPIAFAGIIDLDGDGKSDRIRFEGLVRQNGGQVVAYHDEEGNRKGEINSNTRFLITGTNTGGNAGVSKALAYYKKQAEQYNVQRMSVRRFLDLMGVKLRGSVESLDHRIGKNKQDLTKDKFKPRRPPGRKSAFDDN